MGSLHHHPGTAGSQEIEALLQDAQFLSARSSSFLPQFPSYSRDGTSTPLQSASPTWGPIGAAGEVQHDVEYTGWFCGLTFEPWPKSRPLPPFQHEVVFTFVCFLFTRITTNVCCSMHFTVALHCVMEPGMSTSLPGFYTVLMKMLRVRWSTDYSFGPILCYIDMLWGSQRGTVDLA